MRSIRQVEHLHLLRESSVSDGNRQLGLAVTELIIVQNRLQRHYRLLQVRNFNTDGVRKHNQTHPVRIEGKSYLLVLVHDGGDSDTRSRIKLVEGNGRAYHSLHFPDFDLIGLKRSLDLEIVALQLFRRYGIYG